MIPIPDPTQFLLVLARLGGLVLSAPVFGHLLVPVRVRLMLSLTLAVALSPAVPHQVSLASISSGLALAGALAVEIALGTMLGFVAQLVFAGVELGGQLAGMQMGFGMANLIDPASQAQITVIAHWQQLIVLLVFLALDVHHLLLRALLESFQIAPPGLASLNAGGLRGVIVVAADLFSIGVRIAAPVLVVLLLVNAAMGVLARSMPQMNVFVVGFPINVGVGLFVMGASLPFTVRLLTARFGELEPLLSNLVRGLAHG